MAYSSIVKPSVYFNTKLYTGTDSAQSETGVGFQPDFTWIKVRNYGGSASFEHVLTDAVRGANKTLTSNSTEAEAINNATGYLSSFDSDGFSLAGGATSIDAVAGGARNYASWNWKGNGAGSSNTDGSITSTVSANTTAGFSIVSYLGTGYSATIGHGLGVAPKIYIIKNRTDANDWIMYNTIIDGSLDILYLNKTDAKADSGGSNPTTSVFNIGTNANQGAIKDYIAYCFAEKKGFSKFGSYTGNGSTDGPFVYTGFKPAFVIIKKTDGADNWTINDNKRVGYNVDNNELFANLNNAEDTNDVLDLVSNGFKLRHTAGRHNTSGSTYIYMAFAEEPLVANSGTDGVPATAR